MNNKVIELEKIVNGMSKKIDEIENKLKKFNQRKVKSRR